MKLNHKAKTATINLLFKQLTIIYILLSYSYYLNPQSELWALSKENMIVQLDETHPTAQFAINVPEAVQQKGLHNLKLVTVQVSSSTHVTILLQNLIWF